MNDNLRKEKTGIQQESNFLKQNCEELSNIKSTTREMEIRLHTLSGDNKNLQDENLNLKQQLKVIATELNYKDTKIANLTEEKRSLQYQNNEIEERFLNYKREQFGTEKSNEEFKKKLKEAEKMIENLKIDKKEMELRLENMKDLIKESAETKYLGKTMPEKSLVDGFFAKKNGTKNLFNFTVANGSRTPNERSLSKIKRRRSSSTGEGFSPKSFGLNDKHSKSPLIRNKTPKTAITTATRTKIIRDLQEVILELQQVFSVSNPSKLLSAAYDLKTQNDQFSAFIRETQSIITKELNIEFRKPLETIEIMNLLQKLVDQFRVHKHCTTVLDKLSLALNIKSIDDLPKTITDILKETENLLVIVNKVKTSLRLGNYYLDNRISLFELGQEIEKRF